MESMTGFGKASFQIEGLKVTVYIKSVNSKYLDLSLKLPKRYTFLEERIRKTVVERLSRGKVEIQIKHTGLPLEGREVFLDLQTALNLKEALENLRKTLGFSEGLTFSDFLRFREYLMLEDKEEELDKLWEEVYPPLKEALEQLKTARLKEGAYLKEVLKSHLECLKKEVDKIEVLMPQVTKENLEKLKNRLQKLAEEVKIKELDENRFYQEMVYLLDKMDFTEELNRLKVHLKHFEETLEEDFPGKKLDFLCQEMFREVNTLSNKAQSSEVSLIAVRIKDLIEKLREQVQNIA
ncbi:YicC family protein [Thermodesulfobacterium sp. TA1]|uniref:YicC/YloC family endoribonuclease n=1 Tax=Thermodesulfobacterium sp. TA1 TaxID=2234087 RepID=UPI00123280CC|nr:YicC/YloC family endoribonuclease [Thermodesulfobacterium sp. TA1]QER41508.1 YicC family protein [Thermodesulfobacterium sp. TA1]